MSELKTNTPPTEIKDQYKIHNDRGMIYNPISRKADIESIIEKYSRVEREAFTLKTHMGNAVEFSVPKNITAYDVVPIEYKLIKTTANESVHIMATSLEEAERKSTVEYYSTILPGRVELDLDYLGYVTAENHTENQAIHSGDFKNDRMAKKYPIYEYSEVIKSGNVKKSDYYWFKFRYKNVGDTILNVNGNGTFCFQPILQRKNPDGEWEHYRNGNNLFVRLTDDLYPGEWGEMFVSFEGTNTIETGDYRIIINALIRNETANPENYLTNVWAGRAYNTFFQEFSIKENCEITSPAPIQKEVRTRPLRNKWLHTYEEFMTSFDSWHHTFKMDKSGKHYLFLKCQPWCSGITVKVITGDEADFAARTVFVKTESDSIKVSLDTKHQNYIINQKGLREPAIIAQSMCDMRVNVSLGPNADETLINELLDMKEAGVNLISTTAAFETKTNPETVYYCADAMWFMADVIKQLDMKLEGWITYPYESTANIQKAAWITGDHKKYDCSKMQGADDEILVEACGEKSVYQFKRWGDNYWVTGDGFVPITAEDTRGWHRIDIQNRNKLSDNFVLNFQKWLKAKYKTVENLNEKWGTCYNSFDEIDPQEGTEPDGNGYNYMGEKTKFREWSAPLEDLDIFRTASRINEYKTIIEKTRPFFNSIIGIRTEGGNWTADIPFDTENQRYRHVYYSQRRAALVTSELKKDGIVKIHSDYTTLPYSPDEVKFLTEKSVEAGIMPMHMIQCDRMRDIAVNPHYGEDYSVRYNIKGENCRGVFISTLISAFEWFKATYENGGIPGILWEDYLCDGYVTKTQLREIKFFREKLNEALATPEGKAWANSEKTDTAQAVEKSKGVASYDKEYVASLIEKCRKNRERNL